MRATLDINPVRRYVLEQVEKNPGIRRDDPRLQGAAKWQVQTLVLFGYITESETGALELDNVAINWDVKS